jgi:ferrochelatase
MSESISNRAGVLLVNLGTPDDPSPAAVRQFLKEMLSDPRIVELPKALWWPILHGIVLRTRPRKSAEAYDKIWTPEGSPQLVIAHRLARRLVEKLRRAELTVELGMTYRHPSIAQGLDALLAAGAGEITVLPLYPQYSGATTGAVFDQVSAWARPRRWIPALRFISDYHAQPAYIEALRQSVLEHWQGRERPGRLLMSFHGLPKRNCDRGDPYRTQCEATAHRLAQALDLRPDQWTLSFQSRFGAQEWLKPYTEDTLKQLARQGVKRLGVICPGFSLDCLETLEEIAIRGEETFRGHGGEALDYIPALNDSDWQVECLMRVLCPAATQRGKRALVAEK